VLNIQLSTYFFVIGLTFDICGAWFLAQSFIRKRLDKLVWEGTSGWGSPPNLGYIKSVLEQKAEAYIGFFMLAMGYFLQGIDYIASPTLAKYEIAPFVAATVFVAVGIGSIIMGTFASKIIFRYFAKPMSRVILEAMPDSATEYSWVQNVCSEFMPEIRPMPSESKEEFVSRALTKIGYAGKKHS